MKKLIYFYLVVIFSLVLIPINSFAINSNNVDWEYKGMTVSSYDADVKHYMWETARPPYGPWDRIALHRYVLQPNNWNDDPYGPAPDRRKVFFINPGTYDRGYQPEMNPDTSQFW